MDIFRTNMVTTKDKKLIMASNTTLSNTTMTINAWDDSPKDLFSWSGASYKFNIQTKDNDFGDVSRRKKIYKVYVTFKAGGYISGVVAKYATNGSNTFSGTFDETTYYSPTKGFDSFNSSQANSSTEWITVGLKPSSTLSTNNIHSMQLKFEYAQVGRSNQVAATSSTSVNTITLDSNAKGTVDYYNGMPMVIWSGAGSGYIYRVIDYNNSTKVATLDRVIDGISTAQDPVDKLGGAVDTSSLFDIGYIPKEFQINDINIVYRDKPIK